MAIIIRLYGARVVAGPEMTGVVWSFGAFNTFRVDDPMPLSIETPRIVEVLAPNDARIIERDGLKLCEFLDLRGNPLAISAFRLATFAAAEVYGFRFRDNTNVLNAPFGLLTDF